SGFEYERFRELMTNEVLAAIEGAREAGANEIVIADSHGNMQNLLIEKLPEDVTLVRGTPRPFGMMEGIDDSFDAAVFLGYHSSTTNPEGVRAHTLSSARLADIRLNGLSMTEGGLNAALAGHFGVPVVMISGDDAVVDEVETMIGDVEAVAVKRAIGFHATETMMPGAAYEMIREAVERGLKRHESIEPFILESPLTLEVRFKNYRPAEVMSWLPNVERADAHSIRFVGKDMTEIARFLSFLTHYEPGLEP
ncbi:MAG: M55 family metallopeptidase, partial [Thermoanaerobaculia bacterium]|nr:M55 family metallopeptidase [Thermoanaerobaculia bacterium]